MTFLPWWPEMWNYEPSKPAPPKLLLSGCFFMRERKTKAVFLRILIVEGREDAMDRFTVLISVLERLLFFF